MQRELAAHGVIADVIPFAVSAPDVDGDVNATKSSDILFAGRMDHLKGGLLLLDAVRLIRQRLNRPLSRRIRR